MNFKRLIFFIINIGVIYAVSIFMKNFILENLTGKYLTDTDKFFSLLTVKNDGAAFNLLSGHVDFLVIFAAFIILCCIFYVLFKKFVISKKRFVFLSFFCTGILGNACERFIYGYVTDFFKINLFDFPVFNLYDIFITIGAFLLAFSIMDKKNEIPEK
ncbi:MAG: signal peptidase II [Candidatus Gastranaerophilaceae bacterium]